MVEQNTLPTSANEQATNKPVVIRCGDFSGAFSRFQVACYGDLKLAGFSAEVSHKVAFDYGSDIGNAIRNATDDGLASKIGKAKKDGESRITISGGGTTKTSRAMSLYRLVQQVDSLFREGLINSRRIDGKDMLSDNLSDYVADCETWASEREFAK